MAKLDLKEILREVLIANDIPEKEFSLDGYKEGAICIEKISESYFVYSAEEGGKYDVTKCARLLQACYAVISKVAIEVWQISEIKSIFVDKVILQALEELGIED